MKKILLLVILLLTLTACQEQDIENIIDEPQAKAIEYASDYLRSDIENYIIDIKRVDVVYHEGQIKPIIENGLYGTYFFIEYYTDMGHQDYVQYILVKLWFETELKETIVDYDITIV